MNCIRLLAYSSIDTTVRLHPKNDTNITWNENFKKRLLSSGERLNNPVRRWIKACFGDLYGEKYRFCLVGTKKLPTFAIILLVSSLLVSELLLSDLLHIML